MEKINKDFKERIKEIVTEIETKTDCEIVPMIIKSSNRYIQTNFFASIICSILFTTLLYLSPLHFINPINYIWVQIIGLFIGFFLGNIDFIKKNLIFKKDLKYEVDLRASEAFLHYNLHLTNNHNGILVFISLFERKIKIICDKSIKEKIDQKIWDEVIYHFAEESKSKNIKEALVSSLIQIGAILENNFPNSGICKNNEIENDLIIEI